MADLKEAIFHHRNDDRLIRYRISFFETRSLVGFKDPRISNTETMYAICIP